LSHKQITEIVWAFGHPNIQAIHPTTIMLTKDTHVSKTGDCIVAMTADKSVADLTDEFKEALKKTNAKLTITIEAGGLREQIGGCGSPNLILTHPIDIVIRKSSYVCNRTLAIRADKASNDLPRELIEKLWDPKQKVKVTLTVEG
jgi:hypothetical protein